MNATLPAADAGRCGTLRMDMDDSASLAPMLTVKVLEGGGVSASIQLSAGLSRSSSPQSPKDVTTNVFQVKERNALSAMALTRLAVAEVDAVVATMLEAVEAEVKAAAVPTAAPMPEAVEAEGRLAEAEVDAGASAVPEA
eukprot:581046-Prymnesium_polylepis.1